MCLSFRRGGAGRVTALADGGVHAAGGGAVCAIVARGVYRCTKDIKMKWFKIKVPSTSYYVYLIPISVWLTKLLITVYPAVIGADNTFLSDFIGAFGILYSVLLPLVLVRTLEIFNHVHQEFELEANTAKILYEDILLISKNNKKLRKRLIESLLIYVKHVIDNHQDESEDSLTPKSQGDEIFGTIRLQYAHIVNNRKSNKAESEIVVSELVQRLNELENIRAKRINFSSQVLSGSGFQFIAVLSGTTFLLPFYMVGFTPQSSLIENILVFLLTLIVIYLNLIIEGLAKPFGGTWRISNISWQRLLSNMENNE